MVSVTLIGYGLNGQINWVDNTGSYSSVTTNNSGNTSSRVIYLAFNASSVYLFDSQIIVSNGTRTGRWICNGGSLLPSADKNSFNVNNNVMRVNGVVTPANFISGNTGNGAVLEITSNNDGAVSVSLQSIQNVTVDGFTVTNDNLITGSNTYSWNLDTTGPTVSLSCSTVASGGYTKTSNQSFTATLGDNVTGVNSSSFNLGDIVVTNGTASGLSVTSNTATFTVTPSGQGTVSVYVGALTFSDNLGNLNTNPSNTYSYTYDSISPTVTLSSSTVSNGGYTKTTTQTINVTFTETGSGINDATFTLSDINVTNGAASALTGTGNSWSFTVTPSTQGTVSIFIPAGGISDKTSNTNTISNTYTYLYDTVQPSVALSCPTILNNATNTISNTFNVTITEAGSGINNNSFVLGDISVTNGTASNLTGSGNSWSFTVTATREGTVSVSIPAGGISDNANNTNTASNTYSYIYDITPPTAALTSSTVANKSSTTAGVITFALTFTDSGSGF